MTSTCQNSCKRTLQRANHALFGVLRQESILPQAQVLPQPRVLAVVVLVLLQCRRSCRAVSGSAWQTLGGFLTTRNRLDCSQLLQVQA